MPRYGWIGGVDASLPLWPHQVEGLQLVRSLVEGDGAQTALVRMPTGTGKSGVIAVAAHAFEGADVLVLAPWDALVYQLWDDIRERFWRRIAVAPPYEKETLRFYPRTDIADLAGGATPRILVATIAALERLPPAKYEALKARVGLVFVDEGHYEPAPSWAAAVRGLESRTVLMTATPYRNDFRFFDVSADHCVLYSHQRAEGDRYLRSVAFETASFDDLESFCATLAGFVDQGRFKSHGERVIVRCATKGQVQAVTAELHRLGETAIGIHERFTARSGQHLVSRVPALGAADAPTYWVHQNKLMEGLDDPAFRVIAFFRTYRNERSLIQQIGRVLRNPARASGQSAWVFSEMRSGVEDTWRAYREYDAAATAQSLTTSPRDFVRQQPSFQYFGGRFRELLDLSASDLVGDLNFPRTVRVFVPPQSFSLDEFATNVSRAWQKLDRDTVPVLEPDAATRVHPYIAIESSRLLTRRAFLEFTFGFTVYRLVHGLLFFHDTMGSTPPGLAELPIVGSAPLESLFTGPQARITSIALSNLDLGRQASRRRVLDAYSVGELAPDLADQSHHATIATGRTDAPPGETSPAVSRYVGFTRARISDGSVVPFDEFRDWIDHLAARLTTPGPPFELFARYAEVVGAPADTTPINVLLDFEQSIFSGVINGSRRTLAIDELCIPVENFRFRCVANGEEYEVEIAWNSLRNRYELSSPDLDDAYTVDTEGRVGVADTLIARLNQDQAFRVITNPLGEEYTVYSSGQFLRPRVPLWGRSRSRRLELLAIVDAVEELKGARFEKGAAGSATSDGWDPASVFGIVDRPDDQTVLAQALKSATLMVCDDMNTEIADFIAVDEDERRVALIHCKASRDWAPLSASKLHEVISQALKNLGFLQPYAIAEPPNLSQWDRPWSSSAGTVHTRYRRGTVRDPHECWRRIRAVLRDPSATRDVYLVLGNLLSRSELEAQQARAKPDPQAIQILYGLQSTWSAVSTVGARLRVFCAP